MKKFWVICLLISLQVQSQTYTLSGYVKDVKDGEALIGVSVFTTMPRKGTTTNVYGFYSISLPAGKYEMNYSYLGFGLEKRTIELNKNITLNINLAEETAQLEEVIVTDKRMDENLATPQMGVSELSAKQIQRIPQFLGEIDVIRTLTLLPGVSVVGEGANGFNVRGGNVDQNLILLDEAPIFNSSHLFGFFSIFNGDVVRDLKLYKGGMPAQYGGRLSSVLDVRQKDGNNQRIAGAGGLGLLSSRLMVEGPIVKDKVSFMLAGRRSYQDLFFPLSSNPELSNTKLFFYDFNGKLNWDINERNRIFVSAYYGRDVFGANDLFNFGWGNGTITTRWNHIVNPKIFMNVTAVYSDYTYELGTPNDDIVSFNWQSRIRNYVGKTAFTYYASTRHKIDFGAEATYYVFDPGVISGVVESILQQEFAFEPAVYISDEWNVTDDFTISSGLRYGWFYNLGPRTVRTYDPDGEITDENATGSIDYARGEVIASFAGLQGLEPRLAFNYRVNATTALKLSYNRNRQFIHLISNSTTPTPVDIWRPSGAFIDPAIVDQIAAGYFLNLRDNQLKFSAEIYYKKFRNLVDYRNGANLIFTDNIETELLTGRGRAYGLELLLEKPAGKLTGWIAYTLARTERQIDLGPDPGQWINNGEWYAANWDRPHDLSVIANYLITKRWDISANFAYQTGRPMTPPESRGVFEGIAYPVTIFRNQQRIPDYHRLDLSTNIYFKQKPGSNYESSLNIGVYNVYGRRNAYSVFFRQNTETLQTEAVRLSIFASAIPSITWNFKF